MRAVPRPPRVSSRSHKWSGPPCPPPATAPARDRTRTRRRRSAAETRTAILEAAERRLLAGGPEAIRLQEIAADAGISHPAILHHFGSREGLVEAMVLRGITNLQAQFLEGWPSAKEPDIEGVFDRFYEVASHRGIARMLAWLILSGKSNRTMTPNVFKPAAERMHAGRVRRAQNEGRRSPELEQTQFAATLLFILVLGDSLFGPTVRRSIGLGTATDTTRRFRRWLSKTVELLETRAAHS
jgi:AcrR family transcriptional regulator